MLLITYHSHQPAALLRAHLDSHRTYPEIELVVCIDTTAANVTEVEAICTASGIAHIFCEPNQLALRFARLTAGWAVLLRTEQFLPKTVDLLPCAPRRSGKGFLLAGGMRDGDSGANR
ncbi:MAG: hypothetical protein ETSY2_21935 [Candidatus Entotheonella gemina]|uniref:Uncharacterized protein n=1 Tax=Candidatus Entotheonella gemina TaxID=1429439 RepID=W4M5Y0_9BACT|nr:MAG: hypothetical protein ETSY2_21935 [Candidatus Entotheonella gemina]